MLKDSFKPVRDLVLIKNEYKAKGAVLLNPKGEVALKVLDKTIVAVGPNVESVKVGDCVCLVDNPFGLNVVRFSDNDLDIPKVSKSVKDEVGEHHQKGKGLAPALMMDHNLNNPAVKDYYTVGYTVVSESQIVGVVNSVKDESEVETEGKAIIPV